MGWLELLPLLKRVLPLLLRVAPALESMVGMRAGTQPDVAATLQKATDRFGSDLAALGATHDTSRIATLAALEANAAQTAAVAADVQKLRAAAEEQAGRQAQTDRDIAALRTTVLYAAGFVLLLLVVCVGLLVALFLRHA